MSIQIKCKYCGRIFENFRSNKRQYCSRKCAYADRTNKFSGKNSPRWKGAFKKYKCLLCGKDFGAYDCRKVVKYCSRKCYYKSMKGKKMASDCPFWKGGRNITPFGYIRVYQPSHPRAVSDSYVFEHILVVEKALKRILNPEERIHHINNIKTDNRIENLYLFSSNSEHSLYHQQLKRKEIKEITKSNLI